MINRLILGYYSVNCYHVSVNGIDFIIDPGAEYGKIESFLKNKNIKPDFIINTHGHYDHVAAVEKIIEKYRIPFYIHKNEEIIIRDPEKNMSSIIAGNGLSLSDYKILDQKTESMLEGKGIKIISTPGHTPGSISILVGDNLFSGDLIFKESIGRTDLPGGDQEVIKRSLKKIIKMKRDIKIYPGHGDITDLEHEIENNFYLNKRFLT